MFTLSSISTIFLISTYVKDSHQFPWGKSAWTELNIKHTTNLPNGRIIDWIPIESQAKTIAKTPPPTSSLQEGGSRPVPELESGQFAIGPVGTVPILRSSPEISLYSDSNLLQGKTLPPFSTHKVRRQNAGTHWYAATHQILQNIGTIGTLSMFNPFVQSSADFSLLQTALGRNNPQGQMQTLEAGWINFPDQGSEVHLFSFFNTNGYTVQGDNIGGWNREVQGWVQVDTTIFPGTTFPNSHSTINGAQYDLKLEYQLFQSNWWLSVNDVWIGYYPASLYGDTSSSLAGYADWVDWYGEIFNSENAVTTTDMGSGNFPELGFQSSAYMHNLQVRSGSTVSQYVPSQTIISDPNRYRLEPHWNSGSSWGSFAYLGGPGAGGVVGG